MTDRITKPIKAMKEYGRKPYLVTKDAIPYGEKADYRYMMDTTWHKAQDNEQIIVQSVKKKPYQNSDYQAMEQGYDFPIFTFPRWNFKFDFPQAIYRRKPDPYPTEVEITKDAINDASGLNWIQCPSTVSSPNIYTVIVRNSFTRRREFVNGIQISSSTIFVPTSFKITANTYGAYGLVILEVEHKGATTWVKLGVSSVATGSFNIIATDGKSTISRIISVPDDSTVVFTQDDVSIYKNGDIWREGYLYGPPPNSLFYSFYPEGGGNKSFAGTNNNFGIVYEEARVEWEGDNWERVFYNYNNSDVWSIGDNYTVDFVTLSMSGGNIVGLFIVTDNVDYITYNVLNGVVTED